MCCIVSCCIVLYCIVLYCIVLYCIVLYCIVLYCIVLYCIVLYCNISYYTITYCVVFRHRVINGEEYLIHQHFTTFNWKRIRTRGGIRVSVYQWNRLPTHSITSHTARWDEQCFKTLQGRGSQTLCWASSQRSRTLKVCWRW